MWHFVSVKVMLVKTLNMRCGHTLRKSQCVEKKKKSLRQFLEL